MQSESSRVLLKILLIILTAEFLIMLLLGAAPRSLDASAAAWIDVALLAVLAAPAIFFWVIRPFVLARDEALDKVRALALTDPLTQLANRRLLAVHLEKIIHASARHPVQGALLLIDLDRFKQINDQCGHDVGDAVLTEVANRILAVTRGEDVAARLGGDEFVLLVHRLELDRDASKKHAMQLAERLISLINEPIHFEGKTFLVGASVGVRLLDAPLGRSDLPTTARASSLISEADTAMYDAKKSGRGRAMLFGA